MLDIRSLVISDIEQVLKIEEQAYYDPWNKVAFVNCLDCKYPSFIFTLENKIAGYGIIGIFNEEAHILNLAVANEFKQQGIGAKIIDHLLSVARDHKSLVVILEVRRSNQPAINLYSKKGFSVIGERAGYYKTSTGPEDALVMAMKLNEQHHL